ncbi:Trm112 family protein [Calidifontibacter terrae]
MSAQSDPIDGWLRGILRCPVCRQELLDGTSPTGGPELQCAGDCEKPGQRRGYRIDDGIPVLLADEARIFQA